MSHYRNADEFNQIGAGTTVEVFIGHDRLITGYVSKIKHTYSATSSSLDIAGSGRCGDLTECTSPVEAPKQFKNSSISEIVSTICAPYAIKVIDEVGRQGKVDFNYSPEDRLSKVLEDFVKKYQMIFSEDGNGNLHITRVGAGERQQDLEFGKNVLSLTRTQLASELFSEYVLIGQGTNSSSSREEDSHKLRESARLDWRYRVKVIAERGNATREKLKARAIALRDNKAASVTTYEISVQGWRQEDGRLWMINSPVVLVMPHEGIRYVMLITQVEFHLGLDGMTTKMTLKDPDAYIDVNCSHLQDISNSDSKKKEKQINLASIKSKVGGEWTLK